MVVHKDCDVGWFTITCAICGSSSYTTRTYEQATESFWKEHDRKNKENTMPTYEDGYRKGVEDALSATQTRWDCRPTALEKIIAETRKTMLTKKVTKWTGVITSAFSGKLRILEVCDSFEEAKTFLDANSGPKSGPIEIEIPL